MRRLLRRWRLRYGRGPRPAAARDFRSLGSGQAGERLDGAGQVLVGDGASVSGIAGRRTHRRRSKALLRPAPSPAAELRRANRRGAHAPGVSPDASRTGWTPAGWAASSAGSGPRPAIWPPPGVEPPVPAASFDRVDRPPPRPASPTGAVPPPAIWPGGRGGTGAEEPAMAWPPPGVEPAGSRTGGAGARPQQPGPAAAPGARYRAFGGPARTGPGRVGPGRVGPGEWGGRRVRTDRLRSHCRRPYRITWTQPRPAPTRRPSLRHPSRR